jgi:hypothetical protein
MGPSLSLLIANFYTGLNKFASAAFRQRLERVFLVVAELLVITILLRQHLEKN